MVFNRHVEWSDYDPNTRPSIDGLLLGREPAVDFSEGLGIAGWREIDPESDLIDKVKEEISDLVYDDGEGFLYRVLSNEYTLRLSEWMTEANNILHAIEKDKKIHPEFLVQRGIALANIGAAEAKQEDPDESIIRAYEKKLEKLKEYLLGKKDINGEDIHGLIHYLDDKPNPKESKKRSLKQKYNDQIDELAEKDNRWERVIPKTDLTNPLSNIHQNTLTYRSIIQRWIKEASNCEYQMMDSKAMKEKAKDILDRGLKMIQYGKDIGLADVVRENAGVFYDGLLKLSDIVGNSKGKAYERQYRKALELK